MAQQRDTTDREEKKRGQFKMIVIIILSTFKNIKSTK